MSHVLAPPMIPLQKTHQNMHEKITKNMNRYMMQRCMLLHLLEVEDEQNFVSEEKNREVPFLVGLGALSMWITTRTYSHDDFSFLFLIA